MILWARPEGCSDHGDGSNEEPFCTLERAALELKGNPKYHVLHMEGTFSPMVPIHIPSEETVVLVGPGVLDGTFGIEMEKGASLFLDGIKISAAIHCDDGDLWLERSVIRESIGHGVIANNCEIHSARTVIAENALAGIWSQSSAITMENTFVVKNGNPKEGRGGGVYLEAGSSLDAVYSTFILNEATVGTPKSVACDEDVLIEQITIRNSVALNTGTLTFCGEANVSFSAWSTGSPNDTSIAVGAADLEEVLMPDPDYPGLYRTLKDSALGNLGKWIDGDPKSDFDGELRVTWTSDYVGADKP